MENNGFVGPTPVPSGLTEFVLPPGPDGVAQRFRLDLVEASRELTRILKAHEGATNGEELDALVEWVHAKTGARLNLGQADWLWCYAVHEREQKRADFTRGLQLLSSTVSTPAGSVPAN